MLPHRTENKADAVVGLGRHEWSAFRRLLAGCAKPTQGSAPQKQSSQRVPGLDLVSHHPMAAVWGSINS